MRLLSIFLLSLSASLTSSTTFDVQVVSGPQRSLQDGNIFEAPDSFEFTTDYQRGIVSCPCLEYGDPRADIVNGTNETLSFLGNEVNLATYGFGCALHDKNIRSCKDGCAAGSTITPPPIDCDRSWCDRNFCWVDPNNCDLLNKRSRLFPESNRFYSYATCWDMDSFTQNNRLGSLEGRVLRAGFNSNSGGWLGAYGAASPGVAQGQHFKGPVDRWSGPVVSFVTEAARAGNFLINITEPPEFLRPHSLEYFGPSNFDYCVYTTALGYLDFCVAQYTVTDQRASTTDWLLLGSQDIHLVVFIDQEGGSAWQNFRDSTKTIFQPFTQETWMFIIFLVIPLLGGLMVVHEYGHAGSAFPKMESVVEIDDEKDGQQEIKERKVPLYRHIVRSVYIGYLSVLQQNYSQSVVTYGAMLNLLGISFFILTIIAVYTANLAAILTQQPTRITVSGLEEAVARGYKVCAERKTLEIVQALYPNITESTFVKDPDYLGGDGKPGFVCSLCQSRRRVFQMIQPSKVAKNDSFCHVAIAPLEDLEVEKQNGEFCSLDIVGEVVGQVQTGMPVYEGVSAELISLLLKLKNDGVYDKEVLAARPESQCQPAAQGEGSALSIQQLTGIWVVSFGFALAGLIVTFLMPRIERCRKKHVQSVIGYDQTGQRINMLERGDSWIHNKTIMKNSKRVFVGEDSRATEKQLDAPSSTFSKFGDANKRKSRMLQQEEESTSFYQKGSKFTSIHDDDDDSFNSTNGRNYRYG